jgi:hypothetical protein
MSENPPWEYKIAADIIVSPIDDLIIDVAGGVYLGSADAENKVATINDIGGGAPLSVSNPPAGTGFEGPLPLDLTKSVHRLNGPGDADALYSLADGVEGQIIYLVPNTNTYYLTAVVIVQSARILGDDAFSTATLYTNSDFRPFLGATDASAQSVVTLIFTDGAWQSSSGNWGTSDD